jgi:hypothetical protein
LIRTGVFEANGIRKIAIACYPEGHPRIADATLDKALMEKLEPRDPEPGSRLGSSPIMLDVRYQREVRKLCGRRGITVAAGRTCWPCNPGAAAQICGDLRGGSVAAGAAGTPVHDSRPSDDADPGTHRRRASPRLRRAIRAWISRGCTSSPSPR